MTRDHLGPESIESLAVDQPDPSAPPVLKVKADYIIPSGITATIANGQSLSGAVALGGQLMAGVGVPASAEWTDAELTFQVSVDGGVTFYNLWQYGAEYVLSIPTGRTDRTFFDLPPIDFAAFSHIKLRSGTAATPVAQGAARALQIGRMP
jgi:hypothetical protein